MFRKLINEKARKTNKSNDAQNIKIKGEDIGIPINLPVAIIGDKGSGKSTLLKTLMDLTNESVFNHIYFIYSNLSFDDTEESSIVKVNVDESEEFLEEYFKCKSLFISYSNFIERIRKIIDDPKRKTNKQGIIDDFLKCIDRTITNENENEINKLQYIMKYPKTDSGDEYDRLIDGIINKAIRTVKTLTKPFQILNIKINGFKKDERDAIIIDDIAIASKVLFKNMRDSVIYKYLTLTRHMRLFILFSGQQVDQIPKYIRREIMCWLFSKNTNLELLKGILPNEKIREIENKQMRLNRFQFVIYNYIEGKVLEI